MRRHSADLGALTGGLVLMAAGLFGVVGTPERVGDSLRWLWPLVMLGLGVSLLISSSTRSRKAPEPEPEPPEPEHPAANLFSGEPPTWNEDSEP